jgi:hypothetical protein
MYIYGYIDKNVINEDDAIDGIVNSYRRDVVAGTCTDFRSDAKAKMARGMLNFYENIPEGKAKAIRKAQIQHFSKTKYFKFRNGTFPITPEGQAHIAAICRANGWNKPLSFESYYEEYDF